MKIKLFIIPVLFAIVFNCETPAQPGFDFSGYAQNFTVYQTIPQSLSEIFHSDKSFITDLLRIRLKPVIFLWHGGRLNIDYELNVNYFNRKFIYENLSVTTNRRTVTSLFWSPVNEDKIKINHFIDRLYFRQKLPFGNIKIGRQRIAWGTGRIWNPTDLFNPINPAAYYLIEKPGADAISAKIRFGNFTDLNIVYNPVDNFNKYNFGGRFRTNFLGYDFSIMGGRFDEKTIVGLDFAGNIFDAGFRGEGIYSIDPDNSGNNFLKFIVGIDYQFTPKFYMLAEYHFNGEGKTDKYHYEFSRLLHGEIQNVSRNYLAVSGMYELTPLLLLNALSIFNLNDNSGFISVSGNYSVTENFYVNLGTQIFWGEKLSEYWFFPDSYYIQTEYYF